MIARPMRRFTIADGMILIAASAAGSMLLRGVLSGFLGFLKRPFSQLPPGWREVEVAGWYVDELGSCFVVPLMVGTIAARMRRPRPRWRRVALQTGFVACAACVASLAPGLFWLTTSLARPMFHEAGWFRDAWLLMTLWMRAAVPGAWLMLWLGGLWTAEASWVDRMGRALGGFWLALWMFRIGMVWVEHLSRL